MLARSIVEMGRGSGGHIGRARDVRDAVGVQGEMSSLSLLSQLGPNPRLGDKGDKRDNAKAGSDPSELAS